MKTDLTSAIEYAWGVLALYASDLPELDKSEVFVDAPTRAAGAGAVFAALAHDAAHLLAEQRDIADTTRRGTYHNLRFLDLAQELGFTMVGLNDRTYGHAAIEPDPIVGARPGRARALERLRRALGVVDAEPADWPLPLCRTRRIIRPGKSGVAARCACEPPTTIRIAYGAFHRGPITCGVCGQPFELKGEGQ